jgi:hypothetical protein
LVLYQIGVQKYEYICHLSSILQNKFSIAVLLLFPYLTNSLIYSLIN